MVTPRPSDHDAREALRVLEAIRALQRWLVDQPMGADGLHLTATSLTFMDGQEVVAAIALPAHDPAMFVPGSWQAGQET